MHATVPANLQLTQSVQRVHTDSPTQPPVLQDASISSEFPPTPTPSSVVPNSQPPSYQSPIPLTQPLAQAQQRPELPKLCRTPHPPPIASLPPVAALQPTPPLSPMISLHDGMHAPARGKCSSPDA